MPKLDVKVADYPEQITQPGPYTIQSVKGPQSTSYGDALILIVTNVKAEEGSCFVPYSAETSRGTNLGR